MKRHGLALAIVLLAMDASAQTASPDPIAAAYKDYIAAQKSNDAVAAEAAAERAWRASEAKDGDGARTGILAYNLALARLQMDKDAAAIEPARRAVALADKGAAGINPLETRLTLGEALVSTNYNEAKAVMLPTLKAVQAKGKDLDAAAYFAANTLGNAAIEKREWAVAQSAWEGAFDHAEGSGREVEPTRAEALTNMGIALMGQHKQLEAFELFNQAIARVGPLAPEREDDQIMLAEVLYARSLAWSVTARAVIQSERKLGPPLPPSGERPMLPNKPRMCSFRLRISTADPKSVDNFNLGAAVVRLSIDSSGKVRSSRVLASAPTSDFGEVITKTKSKWSVEKRPESVAGCRMETSDLLITYYYVMGR